MRDKKKLLVAALGAALCLASGGASAIILKFELEGTGDNIYGMSSQAPGPGVVWTYGPRGNEIYVRNQIFTVALKDNDDGIPLGSQEYELTDITVKGLSTSEVTDPVTGFGLNGLADIVGYVQFDNPPSSMPPTPPTSTNFRPYVNVSAGGGGYTCFGSLFLFGALPYTMASLESGEWDLMDTGFCGSDGTGPGGANAINPVTMAPYGGTTGPYTNGQYPSPSDLLPQPLLVNGDSTFTIQFHDLVLDATGLEQPDAVMTDTAVWFELTPAGPGPGPGPAPAPATLGLFGLGLLGLGAIRRRKNG